MIWDPFATDEEIGHALEAMELIAPLSGNGIAARSYQLFRAVMRAPVTDVFTHGKKWQAARFAMHGAYKWDEFLPWVGDPQDILTFLDHHFELATRDNENQDEPIQDALLALSYASGATTIEALNHFDPTEPSFVRGICHVYRDNKPMQLRRVALFFLPLVSDRFFDTPHPIMEPDQMRNLCADWASAVDSLELTHDVQRAALTVLFGMMNSPHWRPYIFPDKWKLLEHFASVPDDFQPLRKCLDNPELVDAVVGVEDPAAMVYWFAILWSKYEELVPEVRERLERLTKEVGQGERKKDLDMCLSVVESALTKAEDALTRCNVRPTDPAGIALKAKIENLRQTKDSLVTLKSGS